MKRAFLLVVAACGTPAAHPPRVEPAAPVRDAGPVVAAEPELPVPSPPVVHPASRAAIEAPHGGQIIALAVAPDGKSAVTADQLGGLRLWPALDGSREPLVVDMPHPRDLAIASHGDGFTIVVRDEVGGLVVGNIDRDGRTLSHVNLQPEPAITGIAMAPAGLVAWRVDQTIDLVGGDGRITGRLAAEAGQRILDVSVAGGHAVALIARADTRVVRVLELEPKLAWGAWLPANFSVGTSVAVSPGGTRYATASLDKDKTHIVVFDSVKGDVVGDHDLAGELGDLAFVDEEHVALANAALGWLTAHGGKSQFAAAAAPLTASNGHVLLATAAGQAFSSANGDLAIVSPAATTTYLGYGVESPTIAQPAPGGKLVVGVADAFVELDKDLMAAGAPHVTVMPGSNVADLRWLGGDDWLVVESGSDGQTRIELQNFASGTRATVREGMTIVPVVMYEPTTKLLTLSLGDTPEVDLYDSDKHVIEKLARLPKPKGYEQAELVPVSPERAGGVQIVRVAVRERPTIQWLKDPRQLAKAAASVTIDNASFAGADVAGHVFVWRNTPQNALELAMYANGKPAGTLPTDGPVALWSDPTGARVVEVGQRTVALYKLDGTKLWTQELAGTTEALWLGDDAIAIVSAAGIARLEAATGKVTAARCGWKFGLTTKPHPVPPQIEPVCVQLEH
jgi:sarcosine oxidase gamma subunit